jgi:2-polyprenyl-3-methyl-5-hydroxy-6-metoxy-1,4-benzoquinol methylase
MSSHYIYSFDPDGDSTAAKLVHFVGSGKNVLELGCAYGSITQVLVKKFNCKIWGVELDHRAAMAARSFCQEVLEINLDEDLDSLKWKNTIGDKKFDVILIADVLEHLKDPLMCITSLKGLLNKDGYFVLSIPNISYNGVIAELLSENFIYRKTGLLDQTHIKFFTAKSIDDLLKSADCSIEQFQTTNIDPENTEFCDSWKKLPDIFATLMKLRELGNVYQYVLKVKPTPSVGSIDLLSNQKSIFNEANGNGETGNLKTILNRDWSQRVEKLRKALVEKQSELMKMSDWASERDKKALELEMLLKEKQSELKEKQSEFMKLSDWAYSMMIELNALKSNFIYRGFKRIRSGIRTFATLVKKNSDERASLDDLQKSIKSNNYKVIVVFPIITWDFRWQRPQHLISGFRDRGYSVLYLAMGFEASPEIYKSSDQAQKDLVIHKLDDDIFQVWLKSYNKLNIYTDKLTQKDLINLGLGLEAVLKAVSVNEIYYLVHFPGWTDLALNLNKVYAGKVIFDCMDDHSGFSTNTADAIALEKKLIVESDLVVVSSDRLFHKVKDKNQNVIVVKNATQFDHFENPIKNGKLKHLEGKPIVGYYGAISDWFDMAIIAYCAKQKPDWNFVLIGSTFRGDLGAVMNLPNIHFFGEVPYKDLPGYLAYFDVCTIPFKIIPLTLATNPVKYYEYICSGKPVVSVELPELLIYQDDCYLAQDKEDFLIKIECALKDKSNDNLTQRRVKLAKENTWSHRVDQFINHPIFLS